MNQTPILIIGHGELPVALISSAQMIIGKRDGLFSLCLQEGDGLENFIQRTTDLICTLDEAISLLVFVDLQGGTPWNAVVGVNDPRIRLVTGVNLPMLIEVLLMRDYNDNIEELVKCALQTAQLSVVSKKFNL